MATQIAAFGIVIFGILVALVAVLEPLSHIAIIIINYLGKLFSGPIKTEPFTSKDKNS